MVNAAARCARSPHTASEFPLDRISSVANKYWSGKGGVREGRDAFARRRVEDTRGGEGGALPLTELVREEWVEEEVVEWE